MQKLDAKVGNIPNNTDEKLRENTKIMYLLIFINKLVNIYYEKFEDASVL